MKSCREEIRARHENCPAAWDENYDKSPARGKSPLPSPLVRSAYMFWFIGMDRNLGVLNRSGVKQVPYDDDLVILVLEVFPHTMHETIEEA